MTAQNATGSGPLWLSIEGKIEELGSQDLSGGSLEDAIRKIAGELDEAGHNVSNHGGNLLHLRTAMGARVGVGHPMMEDLKSALAALTLEDVLNVPAATGGVLDTVGATWPQILEADRRPDVQGFVELARLDLHTAEAKGMDGDKGTRYLLAAEVDGAVIIERLGLSQDELDKVVAAVEAEAAERDRVAGLLEEAGDATDEEKVKLLLNKEVAEDLILELAGVDASVLTAAQKAMEEELKEKQRLAEEAAAKKAAEAAGPSLDDIPDDEMLEYIESIREILEFSDVEKEIRAMCEQSSIPQALVDIAVSEPDKLDELEAKAEG
jgi:hypothetical protein